jgi:hypothetical protein
MSSPANRAGFTQAMNTRSVSQPSWGAIMPTSVQIQIWVETLTSLPRPGFRLIQKMVRNLNYRLWGYDFFISYHWGSGGQYAVNLAQRLRDRNYDVFLDRAEFASGDDWEAIGKIALLNTKRLILIATREAVTVSKPVLIEVSNFTANGRQIVSINFGDSFVELDPLTFPVLRSITNANLYIQDSEEHIATGPSSSTVDELVRTHRVLRRRTIRTTIIASIISLLSLAIIIVGFFWFRTARAENRAHARYLVAQSQLEFDEHPLLGLQLSVQALSHVPSVDSELTDSIHRVVAKQSRSGRVENIGTAVKDIYVPSTTASIIVVNGDRPATHISENGNRSCELADIVSEVEFSPDPGTLYFLVTYAQGSTELRRSSDGTLLWRCLDAVQRIQFSHDIAATYFIVDYFEKRGELRRSENGELIAELSHPVDRVFLSDSATPAPLLIEYDTDETELRSSSGAVIASIKDSVRAAAFSSGPHATYVAVSYDSQAGELRKTSDGHVIATFGEELSDVAFSPDKSETYLVVTDRRGHTSGEIRRCIDGSLLPLSGKLLGVRFSDGDESRAFVTAYEDAPGELRRTTDGTVVSTLTGTVYCKWNQPWVFFSGDEQSSYVAVEYNDSPDAVVSAELRRTADGMLIRTFRGLIREVVFSPDNSANQYFVAYDSGGAEIGICSNGQVLGEHSGMSRISYGPAPSSKVQIVSNGLDESELRRISNAQIVLLPRKARRISFCGEVLWIQFDDDTHELWDPTNDPYCLTEIGDSVRDVQWIKNERVAVVFRSGRSYLLDVSWLRAMKGDPTSLSPDETLDFIRQRSPGKRIPSRVDR